MRSAVIATALLVVAGAAEAAPAPARYRVNGPCRVRTTSGPSYDKTFNPQLDAFVTQTGDDVRIELTGEGQPKCVLRGKRSGDAITVPPGQKCPQRVSDGMAHGELMGVLKSGRATVQGNDVTLTTNWNLEGDVKVLFRKMHIQGTLDSKLAGKRVVK